MIISGQCIRLHQMGLYINDKVMYLPSYLAYSEEVKLLHAQKTTCQTSCNKGRGTSRNTKSCYLFTNAVNVMKN